MGEGGRRERGRKGGREKEKKREEEGRGGRREKEEIEGRRIEVRGDKERK